MKYRTLGKTGLQVSELCLGTMTFGGQLEESESIRLTQYALDSGINFVDTANSYFGGQSEICVGKALKGRRDRVILATKAGFTVGDGLNQKGLSRSHVMQQVEASLRRLDTDYIDIYFMHLPDHVTALEDALDTYNFLIESGKIRYIGMSNFSAWECCEALFTAKMRHQIGPVVTEMVYNLITRGIEQEFLPFVREHNLGLMTYNPLAGGILSGRHHWDKQPPKDSRYGILKSYAPRYWTQENFQSVEVLSALAADHDMTLVELAMRWCAMQQGVTSVITGFSRESQLEQNLASLEKGPLSQDILDACDALWDQISGKRFSYNR